MDAPGILGHVAADAAHHLAGRVRGVIEAVASHRARDPAVDHTGLHSDALVVEIDRQHRPHAAGDHQQGLLLRHGTAGEARAAAAGHKRNPQGMAAAQNRHHLLGGFRQHHQRRLMAVQGEAVAVVGEQLLAPGHHGTRRKQAAQLAFDGGPGQAHGGFGLDVGLTRRDWARNTASRKAGSEQAAGRRQLEGASSGMHQLLDAPRANKTLPSGDDSNRTDTS